MTKKNETKKLVLTEYEVEDAINEILSDNYLKSTVDEVDVSFMERDERGSLFVYIKDDVDTDVLSDISEAFQTNNIRVSAATEDTIVLQFLATKHPKKEMEDEDQEPHIELHHKDRFSDVEEFIIPKTKIRRSNTEMNEQILAWMKQSGRYPLYYQWLADGIHVELSSLADKRIKYVLQKAEAVGLDGETYKLEDTDDLYPMGGSICVRACTDGDRSDRYGVDFFV